MREYWYQGRDDDVPRFIRIGIPTRTSKLVVAWLLITVIAWVIIF
ncbi:hypothetical protein ACFZB5_13310 [Streptomyces nodosus]